jgi:two-component system response regulator AtoC
MAIPFLEKNASMRTLPPLEVIFGCSPQMLKIRQRIERVATANIPVLIIGESGTGKDIIARLIHQLSPWQAGAFVRVTCPSIPGTLLESELFGYERGSFTGATGSKPGRVEMAEGGTLFLDEISELDSGLQSKLLQVLQDGQFCRIGATEDKKVDARLICATNRSLSNEIQNGGFRQDLFYRINGVTIELPPLRERVSDIPALVEFFLETYGHAYNCRPKPLSNQMMAQIQSYHWPGNVRELENLIKRFVILGDEEAVRMDLIPRPASMIEFDLELNKPISLKAVTRKAVHELERKIILSILQSNEWNRKRTAKALNISYRALLYKIREVGVPSKRIHSNGIKTSQVLAGAPGSSLPRVDD